MRTVRSFPHKNNPDKVLHIEFEGGIVNIHVGLHDSEGHAVTRVDVKADTCVGEEWDLPDFPDQNHFVGIRLVQRHTPQGD